MLEDPTAGTDALVEAAGLVDPVRDQDVVAVVRDRVKALGTGGLRARTAAVEFWGVLARIDPFLGPTAAERIEEICRALGDGDGLGAVDVLAAAASALVALPAPRPRSAAERMREAVARTRRVLEAWADPAAHAGVLSEDDQAHLRRELAGTLQRLAGAVADAGVVRDDLDSVRRLTEALPEGLATGVLRDSLVERAQGVLEAAEGDRARRESEVEAAARERRLAERRGKEASRTEYHERLAEQKKNRAAAEAARAWGVKEKAAVRAKAALEAPAPPQASAGARQAPLARPTAHRPTRRRLVELPSSGDGQDSGHAHLSLLLEAEDQWRAGNLPRSRELLEEALRSRPAAHPQTPADLPSDWTVDLCQAMGAAGEPDAGEALAQSRPDTGDRARHLAALSLGCSLAGHDAPGTSHAQAAARLVPDGAAPALANAVAQALAHSGDERAASAMAAGGSAAQRRQARTAVAVGLVRHRPDEAARVAGPLVESLARRVEAGGLGSSLSPLPELAALLLAFPDPRRPDPRLGDVLHRAALRVADPSTVWPKATMAVLTLLQRLGCLPDADSHVVARATDRWRRSLPRGPEPSVELALLAAVDGDIAAVRRHADGAWTPDVRSTALRTAAAHLAGAQVALATDSDAGDRVVRTCLALARKTRDTAPQARATARHIALELVRSDAWTHTIPLLPALAPDALRHLGAMAGA